MSLAYLIRCARISSWKTTSFSSLGLVLEPAMRRVTANDDSSTDFPTDSAQPADSDEQLDADTAFDESDVSWAHYCVKEIIVPEVLAHRQHVMELETDRKRERESRLTPSPSLAHRGQISPRPRPKPFLPLSLASPSMPDCMVRSATPRCKRRSVARWTGGERGAGSEVGSESQRKGSESPRQGRSHPQARACPGPEAATARREQKEQRRWTRSDIAKSGRRSGSDVGQSWHGQRSAANRNSLRMHQCVQPTMRHLGQPSMGSRQYQDQNTWRAASSAVPRYYDQLITHTYTPSLSLTFVCARARVCVYMRLCLCVCVVNL